MKTGGWLGHTWTKPYEANGNTPPNPRADELKIQGLDGGNVQPAALDIEPSVITDGGTEPKVQSSRFRPSLSSFDYAVIDYEGGEQFLSNNQKSRIIPGWWSTPDPPVSTGTADISERVWAVRARYHASVSANVHEITVRFKKDGRFDRLHLAGFRTGKEEIAPFVYLKDREGAYVWQAESPASFKRTGVLDSGGYFFPGNYRGGAVGVVNLGPEPIDYTYAGQNGQLFVDGKGRSVRAGDTMTVRFLALMRPWQGQMNNEWIQHFVSGFGIACPPGYSYAITQGKLRNVNYSLDLEAEHGGAAFTVGKFDLPHNLVVRIHGLPGNAMAGRYDTRSRQLLFLPIFEGTASTSVRTNDHKTSLYVGELFRCENDKVLLSAVQEGSGTILLEIHNPTPEVRVVRLKGVPGFRPLAELSKTIEVAPFDSEKLVLKVAEGSLDDSPYSGD